MAAINVKTTQHVQIEYSAAGITERIGAFLIDSIILGIYSIVTITLLSDLWSYDSLWIIFLLVIIPAALYHLLMEIMFDGQSLGKKAVDIKVLRLDGSAAGLGSYFIRWIFRLFEITITSGALALFTILFNGRGQRLGDLAAGTAVVKINKKTSLSDTLYAKVTENYRPTYPQVAVLDDKDISVVREVLATGYNYDRALRFKMLNKVRRAVEKKTGISVADTVDSKTFLQTIIKDYNAIYG